MNGKGANTHADTNTCHGHKPDSFGKNKIHVSMYDEAHPLIWIWLLCSIAMEISPSATVATTPPKMIGHLGFTRAQYYVGRLSGQKCAPVSFS